MNIYDKTVLVILAIITKEEFAPHDAYADHATEHTDCGRWVRLLMIFSLFNLKHKEAPLFHYCFRMVVIVTLSAADIVTLSTVLLSLALYCIFHMVQV